MTFSRPRLLVFLVVLILRDNIPNVGVVLDINNANVDVISRLLYNILSRRLLATMGDRFLSGLFKVRQGFSFCIIKYNNKIHNVAYNTIVFFYIIIINIL